MNARPFSRDSSLSAPPELIKNSRSMCLIPGDSLYAVWRGSKRAPALVVQRRTEGENRQRVVPCATFGCMPVCMGYHDKEKHRAEA